MRRHDTRSKSATVSNSKTQEEYTLDMPYQPYQPYQNITTNTQISLPAKRKLKFVYGGDEQQNVDPNIATVTTDTSIPTTSGLHQQHHQQHQQQQDNLGGANSIKIENKKINVNESSNINTTSEI